jgi:hypothetical protein
VWDVYTNDEYQFQISYPSGFDVAEVADTLVVDGAVVTFAPKYDPSISAAGAKTNLISISITVGVSDSPSAPESRCERRTVSALRSRDLEKTRFTRGYRSEGAVGNRYETSTVATDCDGKHYEIALFVHSANPGCYPAGAITIFDSAKVERLFETMLSTFSLHASSERS